MMAGYDQMGPASTPQLYLEQSYNQMTKGFEERQAQLADQQLQPDQYDNEVRKMQAEFDDQRDFIMQKKHTLQKTQDMIGLGLLSEQAGMESNWATVLPQEVMAARTATMTPPKEEKMTQPFSPSQLDAYGESAEEFAEATEKGTIRKRYLMGVDRLAPDVRGRTQKAIMRQYKAWRTNIGYDSMDSNKQRQVDSEWDSWVGTQGKKWKWNIDSDEVKAMRAKGPLSRGYGAQFRGTPTGPTEARNPLHDSVMRDMPKKSYDEVPIEAGMEEDTAEPKALTRDIAVSIMQEAGGDRMKAREIAAERGYSL
jgi:hypothetical protein